MDTLFARYACPFSLLDNYIRNKRLCEFIDRFGNIVTEESEEKFKWEFFLHKIFDKSYSDWDEENKINRKNAEMSEGQIETAIEKSMSILKKFNPS